MKDPLEMALKAQPFMPFYTWGVNYDTTVKTTDSASRG